MLEYITQKKEVMEKQEQTTGRLMRKREREEMERERQSERIQITKVRTEINREHYYQPYRNKMDYKEIL